MRALEVSADVRATEAPRRARPISPGLLVFAQDDQSQAGVLELAQDLMARGVDVMLAGGGNGPGVLPTVRTHPNLEPIARIQSFYRMANALSILRGHDPDKPPHLNKVTETI